GLDHFCLELHSEKARKKDVLSSLKARLELTCDPAPARLDAKLSDLSILRTELNRYAQVLNAPIGRSGMTAHDVLWAARRAQDTVAKSPERLRKITVKNAVDLTADSRARAKVLLQVIED